MSAWSRAHRGILNADGPSYSVSEVEGSAETAPNEEKRINENPQFFTCETFLLQTIYPRPFSFVRDQPTSQISCL